MNVRLLTVLSWCGFAVLAAAQPRVYPGQPIFGPEPQFRENPMFEYHLALGWVKDAAEDLEKRWRDRLSAEAIRRLAEIREDAEYLQARWKDWAADRTRRRLYTGGVKSELYYQSLEGYRRRMKQVLRSPDVDEVQQVVADVAADMRLKASNCRQSEDGLGKDIIVRVRTLRGTEEVGGCEVWCVPRALLQFKNSHVRFPKVSSPAVISNLSAGNYLLWVIGDGVATDRVPQTIGGNGQKEVDIDLLVP